MKALLQILLVFLGFSLASNSTASDVYSGNAFLGYCESVGKQGSTSMESLEEGICLGYITGAYGMMSIASESFSAICPPKGASVPTGQLVRILKTFMENNPKFLHEHIHLIFLRALKDAYPCPESGE